MLFVVFSVFFYVIKWWVFVMGCVRWVIMEVFVKDYVIFFVKEMCVIKLLEFVLVDVIWDIMECIVINFVVIVIYRVVMIELVIV